MLSIGDRADYHRMPDASTTVQIATALTRRLMDSPTDGTGPMPEMAFVQHIATRAAWRAGGGDRRFEPLAARVGAWPNDGCRYDAAVRLARDYVMLVDAAHVPGPYAARVAAEFDDALALAPVVIMLPSFETLDMVDLLRVRATAVRVIGLRERATDADGALCTPAEFLWHDLDHVRFMVREDLAALGVTIADAYGAPDATGGRSTLDDATGTHRCILAAAITALAVRRAAHARLMLRATHTVDRLLAGLIRFERDRGQVAAAARLTLFEVCHEKSFTPVPEILRRELVNDAHAAKIRHKLARRFWGDAVDPSLAAHLDAARTMLMDLLDDRVRGT
ncbi:hypothetical protein [Reyranella sp. CPCC 100927]|uniref:hypothetical protein n=1 Tax=Reyranella sp. CPCC 100927 TaxID=2599616 RepID=UPI0011B76C8A|nr:hypothetical protein [Reyranella sp. CPCC 100927]TWT09995.1 hypothetical protein FQU96_18035 [Reyranella sp. CPCC 100927]